MGHTGVGVSAGGFWWACLKNSPGPTYIPSPTLTAAVVEQV